MSCGSALRKDTPPWCDVTRNYSYRNPRYFREEGDRFHVMFHLGRLRHTAQPRSSRFAELANGEAQALRVYA